MKLMIPLSIRRHVRYSIMTDQMKPLRRYLFLNISRDPRICFANWGVALTIRFGVFYA